MSYAMPENPGGSAPRVRPATVPVSTVLMLVVAALLILGLISGLLQFGTSMDVYREVYGEGMDVASVSGLVLGLVINGLLAVAFVVLAFTNLRGSNASRITTWVLAGIGLCCSAGGLAVQGSMGALMDAVSDVDPLAEEYARRLEEAQADWIPVVGTISTVVILLSLIAVIILLALPASNAYFRKQPPPAAEVPPYPTVQ